MVVGWYVCVLFMCVYVCETNGILSAYEYGINNDFIYVYMTK